MTRVSVNVGRLCMGIRGSGRGAMDPRSVAIVRKKTIAKRPVPSSRARAAASGKAVTHGSRTSAEANVGRITVLDVPFAMRAVASAGGAKWDPERGVFLFVGDTLPAALEPFLPLPYSYEESVQDSVDEAARPGLAPRALRTRGTGAITPRPHQDEAAEAIRKARDLGRPGFLLADDVGLGKTIAAWAAVLRMPTATRAAKPGAVLIVAPLSVLAHWRHTVLTMGDGGRSVVILNYDRLGKLFEVTPTQRKKIRTKKGLARAGTAPAFDVVIWDESHRCKNPTAARSKLAAKLTSAASFCLWLSATAGQNPLELSYLAPLLANVTGARTSDLKDFEVWCSSQGIGLSRGAYGKWEWSGNAEDCRKVRALLFDARGPVPPAGMRRRPEDIAGWPPLNRILAPIELDAETRALYKEAWTTFRKELQLEPRGKNPKGALAAALRLRQKSSLLRASGTVELVRELLDNGHQVAVSVAFKETLDLLRSLLEDVPCAEIHGGLAQGPRERERLRFQRGECKVALFTVEEGISLHQGEHNDVPRSEVIHDLRWSAIQMAQIEGRCHRDGKFAQVYWAYADGTVEDRIARVVAGRIHAMKEMIGDDTETLREIEAILDSESA